MMNDENEMKLERRGPKGKEEWGERMGKGKNRDAIIRRSEMLRSVLALDSCDDGIGYKVCAVGFHSKPRYRIPVSASMRKGGESGIGHFLRTTESL